MDMYSLMIDQFIFNEIEDDLSYDERDLTDEEWDELYEDPEELDF